MGEPPPDVILRLATKEVLVETKNMSWGTDTRLYRNTGELRDALPGRVRRGAAGAEAAPRDGRQGRVEGRKPTRR